MRFSFPDPADFPENDAVVYEYESDDPWQSAADLVPDGRIILNEMRRRADAARQSYEKIERRGFTPLAGMYDTSGLAKTFEAAIKGTAAKMPGSDIKSVDRATLLQDDLSKNSVRNFMKQIKFWEPLQEYADLDIKSVTVQVSNPGDRHHYQQFRDCETETKLLNLHVDPKPGIVKAIIYLNEVTEENGPFECIPESHEWEYDEEERIHAWGNSVGNYLHTPLHRQAACALPSKMRRNAIIGRLTPDGSEMGTYLLSRLVSCTEWNVMMFDPCFTFHRGGLCKSGTRVNLQVVFS